MSPQFRASTAPLLGAHVGQRAEGYVWDVVDADNNVQGRVYPWDDDTPSIRHNVTSDIMRVVDGFVLSETQCADLDMLTSRLRPSLTLDDGSTWPLGVFMFAASDDLPRQRPGASYRKMSLYDRGNLLRDKRREAYGLRSGASIPDAIGTMLDEVGITDRAITVSGAVTGDALAWPPGTTRLAICRHLCALCGAYRPYFNNPGTCVVRPADDLDGAMPTVSYYTGSPQGRIVANTSVYAKDLFDAPNVYVVVGTGATESEVSGMARVPASMPHSVENRGREIVEVVRVQGLTNTDAAVAAAQSIAAQSIGDFVRREFDAAPDPRHDTFDVIEVDGVNYREVEWGLKCKPGGTHTHKLRQAYSLVEKASDSAPSGVGRIAP